MQPLKFNRTMPRCQNGNIIIRKNEKMRTIMHCEHQYITMRVCEGNPVLLRKSLIFLLVWLYYANSTALSAITDLRIICLDRLR